MPLVDYNLADTARCPHAVPVVLDHVHAGSFHRTGHVEASWTALVAAPSPKKVMETPDAAAILDREADAGAERHVAADDAVAAEEVLLVQNMCIEPPLPRRAVVRPNSSAITRVASCRGPVGRDRGSR